MTEQTKSFVELSDILAFRVECSGCHCSIAIPITKYQFIPKKCPNGCGKDWEPLNTRALAESLTQLQGAIQEVERMALHQGVLFSLEIQRVASGKPLKEKE